MCTNSAFWFICWRRLKYLWIYGSLSASCMFNNLTCLQPMLTRKIMWTKFSPTHENKMRAGVMEMREIISYGDVIVTIDIWVCAKDCKLRGHMLKLSNELYCFADVLVTNDPCHSSEHTLQYKCIHYRGKNSLWYTVKLRAEQKINQLNSIIVVTTFQHVFPCLSFDALCLSPM